MDPIKQESPLNIIIVGAGIGGLAAGLGLRRQGHNVRIFEKSKFGNEIGAAVALPVNVHTLLKRLGVDPEEHGSNTEDIRTFYTRKGDIVYQSDLTGYNGAARLMHRVDLHEALKGAAVAQGVQISLASRVESVDPEEGSITLSNGQSMTADVVIGADGIHSVARKFIASEAPSPSPFPISVFRMLIPCSKLTESPDTIGFVDRPGKLNIFMSDDGRRIINYPCRSNTIMNVVALFPTRLEKTYDNEEDLRKHMLEVYSDFHQSPIALLTSADKVGTWKLFDLPALSNWSCGRAALIGDAAHPLLPYSAQGAAQALEDAGTLAVLLGRGTTVEQVPERLKLYFEIRHERVDWVQEFGRTSDQAVLRNRGVKSVADVAKFFGAVYEHDAWDYAEERLRERVLN